MFRCVFNDHGLFTVRYCGNGGPRFRAVPLRTCLLQCSVSGKQAPRVTFFLYRPVRHWNSRIKCPDDVFVGEANVGEDNWRYRRSRFVFGRKWGCALTCLVWRKIQSVAALISDGWYIVSPVVKDDAPVWWTARASVRVRPFTASLRTSKAFVWLKAQRNLLSKLLLTANGAFRNLCRKIFLYGRSGTQKMAHKQHYLCLLSEAQTDCRMFSATFLL